MPIDSLPLSSAAPIRRRASSASSAWEQPDCRLAQTPLGSERQRARYTRGAVRMSSPWHLTSLRPQLSSQEQRPGFGECCVSSPDPCPSTAPLVPQSLKPQASNRKHPSPQHQAGALGSAFAIWYAGLAPTANAVSARRRGTAMAMQERLMYNVALALWREAVAGRLRGGSSGSLPGRSPALPTAEVCRETGIEIGCRFVAGLVIVAAIRAPRRGRGSNRQCRRRQCRSSWRSI